jgi:hypothetical protein
VLNTLRLAQPVLGLLRGLADGEKLRCTERQLRPILRLPESAHLRLSSNSRSRTVRAAEPTQQASGHRLVQAAAPRRRRWFAVTSSADLRTTTALSVATPLLSPVP